VPRPEGPAVARIEVAYVLEVASPEARPIVEVLQRRIQPRAPVGPWEPARLTQKAVARYEDDADREILGALLGVMASTASQNSGVAEAPPSRFALSRAACASLLPQLGRTGRFALRRGRGELSLVWHEAPWSFRLRVAVLPDDAWDVYGVLCSAAANVPLEVPLADVDAFVEGGYAVARGLLARVDDGGASSWLGMLLTHRRVRITAARRASFLEELYSLPTLPRLDLPETLALLEVAGTPRPRLLVHPPDATAPSAALFAGLSFTYGDGGDVIVAARRPGKVAFDAERTVLVRRDVEVEARAAARLEALGAQVLVRSTALPPPDGAHLTIAPARLPALVSTLVAEGWTVEAGGRTYRKPTTWQMSVRSGVDWLDLEGTVQFDGLTAMLPAVLEALRRGANAVVLDDGSLGLLPEEWLLRHGIVLRLGTAHEGRVRFARSQAPLLDALAAAEPRLRVDVDFERARAAAAAGAPLAPADPPPSFHGELRGYQREGLGWLRSLERSGFGGLLADDMGLGKTVQVLAHLAGRASAGRPSLVVAPRSLVFNWKREAARFAPQLRVLDHTGPDRRPPGAHFAEHDLVLTTYGTLRRDADAFAATAFDYVILDEAQAIKNDGSETARVARRLNGERRLALTGTPVENHLGELWSIVEFLNPGLLGRASAWKSATDASPSPEAVTLLGRALQPFMLRRTKAMVAPDLPARLEETLVCELGAPERALYEELRARFRAELLGTARTEKRGLASAGVLEALLRLRQAACHPGLIDPARRGARSAKLDALLPRLAALRDNGQKALVFSQFRKLLDLARPIIEAEGIPCIQLDGGTRDREAVVARFQEDPACSVLLISLKAGGVGLNLTAAEYVFLLDPWWNPAAEAQAIDRAHRIGQARAVFAYRLIARDTVEERIAQLQQSKRLLAESVIRGDGAPLRDLSLQDLEELLS
jgi:superfamily II DNA or RNA helicase